MTTRTLVREARGSGPGAVFSRKTDEGRDEASAVAVGAAATPTSCTAISGGGIGEAAETEERLESVAEVVLMAAVAAGGGGVGLALRAGVGDFWARAACRGLVLVCLGGQR